MKNAWFWGALIVILTVATLLFLCVFYCCVCCCVYCGKRTYTDKSYKCPKIGCGLFTTLLIITSFVLLCVSLWLETRVDNNLTMSNLTASDSVIDIGSVVLINSLEFYRFRAAIGVLAVTLFALLLSLFGFCFAPACKSPAAIIIFMVLHVLLALLLSVYAGVTFALVVFGSDFCVNVYSSGCAEIGSTLSSTMEAFCSSVILDSFTIVMLTCAVIVILFSLQIFGSIYANLITKSKYARMETVGQSSEIFISTPLHTGGTRFHGAGVWDAYGAQTVLGVKSRGQDIPSGYSPEAYPMGAVAPVAPIAPLPTDNYNGMKEVTLHVKEVDANDDSSDDLHIMDV